MPGKKKNPKKTEEEERFENELKKLKLSAEHGAPFSELKKEELTGDPDEDFLAKIKQVEDAIRNPSSREIKDLLGFPNFPKVDDLKDDELGPAIEMVNVALANENIFLDVIYPTPEREIYRFLTEEIMEHDAGMAGAGGMMMHLVYEEFYPNHSEEIKEDVTDTLHFICRGYRAKLPWRISHKVKLHGKTVPEEEFLDLLASHRDVFEGMSFIGVDSIDMDIGEEKATAKAVFRYYLDESSGSPGEEGATAQFYFKLSDDSYLINRLVIENFGIK